MRAKYIVVFFLLCSGYIFAQEIEIQKTVDELFNLCENGKLKNAAELLCTSNAGGKITELDYSNPKQKRKADRLMKKIKALLQLSDSHSVTGITKIEDGESRHFSVEVEFKSGEQALRSKLIFASFEKGFKLVELK